MSFDFSEYLDVAKELAGLTVQSVSQEAKLRSSISRAYYAAYCKARYFAFSKGVTIPEDTPEHKFIREYFKSSNDATQIRIGDNLGILGKNRTRTDYDIIFKSTPFSIEHIAKLSIKFATDVLNDLTSL